MNEEIMEARTDIWSMGQGYNYYKLIKSTCFYGGVKQKSREGSSSCRSQQGRDRTGQWDTIRYYALNISPPVMSAQ